MPEFTQFEDSAPVGGKGLYVGDKGSEVQVSDASGNIYSKGVLLNGAVEVATTASTAVTSAYQNIEINLSSGAGVVTIDDLASHQGYMTIKQTGASTAGASVTATAGTWDGTNNVATTNAANDFLCVHIDSNGNGSIVENVGSVALS